MYIHTLQCLLEERYLRMAIYLEQGQQLAEELRLYLIIPFREKERVLLKRFRKEKDMCDPEACVDYAFHCCITDLNGGTILDEFKEAVEYGITSFKCFLVYKKEGMMVEITELWFES